MKMLTLRVCLLLSMFCLASSPALADPLHDAVRKGDLDEVRQLIDEGADLNARDELGLTSLHAAVLVDHIAIAELLIAKGANINARASNGHTPWDLAVALRRTAMAELLEPKPIPLKTDIDKEAWISDLETLIPQLMERAHVPGLSIAVIRR